MTNTSTEQNISSSMKLLQEMIRNMPVPIDYDRSDIGSRDCRARLQIVMNLFNLTQDELRRFRPPTRTRKEKQLTRTNLNCTCLMKHSRESNNCYELIYTVHRAIDIRWKNSDECQAIVTESIRRQKAVGAFYLQFCGMKETDFYPYLQRTITEIWEREAVKHRPHHSRRLAYELPKLPTVLIDIVAEYLPPGWVNPAV
jgi:hypothetical protein